MRTMVFDIETLPAAPDIEPLVREQYDRVPNRAESYAEFHRKTGLSGNYGSILCIAYAIDREPAVLLKGDEAHILRDFWAAAASIDRFVGHHIFEFDLPFIYKRSVIHGIKPTQQLDYNRYQSSPIYDTKREWDSWSSAPGTGLDALAKILGLPTSKIGIDGSQVYDFWLAGKTQEIYDYCQRDVELNREIYWRMTFRAEEK